VSALLVTGLSELATPTGVEPRSHDDQARILRIAAPEVLCRDGRIEFVGTREERHARYGPLEDVERLHGHGGTLIPGFVDPHTHLPWAGDRADEFAQRLAGKTYMEIAASGGGILATVSATRTAPEHQLVELVRTRLDRMLEWGTTTAEAKSGYGLHLETELKQLRAIRTVSEDHPVDLVPTLLAAHEVPPEHREDRKRFLDHVCLEIIPRVAEEKLALFSDVFCEEGVFSREESLRVLQAGLDYGLRPRLHADEFVDSGGAELAAELGALSADHLVAVSDSGIESLASSSVTAVLLPGTSFFLMKHAYAPARRLIASGVPVALATDCNPGSSHTESMPMIFVLAVLELGLSIEEALTATTLNAACTLGRGTEIGSLEVGKNADLVLLEGPSLNHLAYHFGINPVEAVVKNGKVVHRSSRFAAR
jgi:imidazolonepropionase